MLKQISLSVFDIMVDCPELSSSFSHVNDVDVKGEAGEPGQDGAGGSQGAQPQEADIRL